MTLGLNCAVLCYAILQYMVLVQHALRTNVLNQAMNTTIPIPVVVKYTKYYGVMVTILNIFDILQQFSCILYYLSILPYGVGTSYIDSVERMVTESRLKHVHRAVTVFLSYINLTLIQLTNSDIISNEQLPSTLCSR